METTVDRAGGASAPGRSLSHRASRLQETIDARTTGKEGIGVIVARQHTAGVDRRGNRPIDHHLESAVSVPLASG